MENVDSPGLREEKEQIQEFQQTRSKFIEEIKEERGKEMSAYEKLKAKMQKDLIAKGMATMNLEEK